MNVLDLFSGIGGFHKGLLQAGAQIDWCGFSEIDKYAISVYKRHFKESEELGNVRTIDATRLPRIDLLCGGFPCQAFSIAGKRQGFEDTRGTLFFEIARMCEQIRPKIVFLENVRGLLSHDSGATFETIIRTLGDLGYIVQWQVCNSRYFGVPQNRERVFIVGHYGKGSFRQVFPIREGNTENNGDYTGCLDANYAKGDNRPNNKSNRPMIEITKDKPDAQRIYDPSGIAKTLKGLGGGQGAKTGLYQVYDDYNQTIKEDPIACTLTGNVGSKAERNGQKIICHNLQPRCGDPDKGGTEPLNRDDGKVYCLDTGNTQAIETNKRVRRLTPIECERLQGFPDNWTKYGHEGQEISDSQRYKMCGNSVTVNVIEAIAKKLL
jgi:DNA (cytosine-5)-methyltransferase 1